MDPEGARLLTYSVYSYGKPRLPPVHKYSSLRSTALYGCFQGSIPLPCTRRYTHYAGSVVVKV